MKQLWDIGLHEYVNDMWNVIDFITNSLYVATVALRVVSYFQVNEMFYMSHSFRAICTMYIVFNSFPTHCLSLTLLMVEIEVGRERKAFKFRYQLKIYILKKS